MASSFCKHPDEEAQGLKESKDAEWVKKIKDALSQPKPADNLSSAPSIFMAPAPLRGLKHQAFIPQVVPIGPYHCDVGPHHSSFPSNHESRRYIYIAAQEMLRHKIMASKYVATSFKPGCSSSTLASNFEHMYDRIKQEYDSHLACDQSKERLALMLALDASFVVEVLKCNAEEADLNIKRQFYRLRSHGSTRHRPRLASWNHHSSVRMQPNDMQQGGAILIRPQEKFMDSTLSSNDMGFNAYYCNRFPLPLRKSILQDFMMLENQIPFFCLLEVVQMERSCKTGSRAEAVKILGPLILQIALEVLPFPVNKEVLGKGMQERLGGCKHLLDYLYLCLTYACPTTNKEDLVLNPTHFPRAVHLHNSGIRFRPLEISQDMIQVRFDPKTATLHLPKVRVGDDTERLFRNLIAYESHMIDNVLVLSYLRFMNNLVDDADDVALLIHNGIITEDIGSELEVAHMWNNLCVNTMRVCSKAHEEVAQQMAIHCDRKINRWKAELVRTYFSKPWLILSLFSGFSLLLMTFLILIYTIYIYNKPGA